MTAAATSNLAFILERRADPGAVAFLVGDEAFTHGEVHDGGARVASALAGLGVGRGDRVLIALPDGIAFVWTFLGAVRLGAIAVPVNPRLTAADHRAAADGAGARVVVCGADLADRFSGRRVFAADGLRAAMAGSPRAEPATVDPSDAAYALYTSGTTGVPKAAVHAHGDPLVHYEAFALPALGLVADDVVLSVSKLYFAYGLGNSLFFPLLAGCAAVLHADHPVAGDVVGLVRRHRVRVLFSVPTFYARMVAATEAGDWTSLRAAVSAGETLPPALAAKVRAVLGCAVLDGLGSTEVGQTFASNTLGEWWDGTVGRALPPYEVEVRDELGNPLGPNEVGELWVAGPTLPIGWLGPAGVEVRTGRWLATGDRAALDRDGVVRLLGRVDDVEQVGGISLSPHEIEALLSGHAAVSEVAVAGVIGPDGASRLEAFVVPTSGADEPAAIVAELVALARAELAPFKVPQAVAFVASLPRTPTGKLRRHVLRAGGWGTQQTAAANLSR